MRSNVFFASFSPRLANFRSLFLVAWMAMGLNPAHGVLFYDTADAGHNTTAPSGTYAGSGWQYLGTFGSFVGTAIGPNHFITAAHIGVQGSTFTQTATFTGLPNASYNIDTSAFGGVGYYDVPGTDLRLYQTLESFANWAPLYEGSSELGQTAVVTGNGGVKAGEVWLGADLKGWTAAVGDGTTRWGTNVISGVMPDALSPVGELLVADFNALPSTDEAMLSSGDSGAALFINDGGTWKLAGVNYAVDGAFNTSPTNAGAFGAALFDKGGYWEGEDPTWQFNTDLPTDAPSAFYASRISSSATVINGITGVPEPGSALLLVLAGLWVKRRRR